MVKHSQIIRRLLQGNCLSVFDYLEGLTIKGFAQFGSNFPGYQIKVLS